MITKLIIHHFKSLEDVEIDLSNISVFVGKNAAGKTNLIDAIRFVRDALINGLDRAISDRHGITSIRQWSPTKPYRISITVLLEEGITYRARYHFSIDSAKSEFSVFREEAEIYERTTDYVEIDREDEEESVEEQYKHSKKLMIREQKGKCETKQWDYHTPMALEEDFNITHFMHYPSSYDSRPESRIVRAPQADELVLNFLRSHFWEFGSLRMRLSNFQAYAIYPNTMRSPQEPSNETYLLPEGRNFTSVFRRMRRTPQGQDAINQITEAMKSLMPNLERITVLNLGGYLVPQFHVVERSDRRHIFNVSQLSDGTLRVLGLLTALYQVPKPGIIALEEPEQTVNPGILTVLADSIKEVSRGTQVLVTTHSPNLLDQFPPEAVKAVELVDGKTTVGEVNARQIEVVKERLFSLGELLTSEGLYI